MSKGTINKVLLIGNLGADPEIRQSSGGSVIASLRIATSENWKDQQGQAQERTEWHRVVVFGRTAEVVRDYVKKGSKIYIDGRLQTRKWQDKDGQDRYTTEIVANELQMLDRSGSTPMAGGPTEPRGSYDRASSRPAQDMGHDAAPSFGGDDFDDDIPF